MRWILGSLGLMMVVLGCSQRSSTTSTTSSPAARPQLFLGVPENETRTIDQKNPEIDYRLRGITTITKVEPSDYATFLEFKKGGKIVEQETRNGFVFFSIEEMRHVPLQSVTPGEASGAYVKVMSRFKAPIPNGK